ncbi:class I SAM-dependent methyltransferase [Sulfitobacter sp. S190]|uniref:class I SAM-dependent methyltransferase n=1 Tax=Sulfitobacter sp. S190 TaxID=2867022 RepID=UPI0021A2BA92|nr:class I SAM-dependent methyltransferase [Sulfitobacter sp. S190]UWR22520.1 class I SAM-dependent methyltransferase [Sulfitobacter sp. S190]
MSAGTIAKIRQKLADRVRMIRARSTPSAAPAGVPQTREGALDEPEAVALSHQFNGWLNVPASIVTLHLLRVLPFGPVAEIGVYYGKYLSVLRAAMGRNCRIVGYDIFNENQVPRVEDALGAGFGGLGNIRLVQVDSTTLTPERVLRDCGGAPVFISVDGSHEAEPVLSDMRLAEAVLDPRGIVAMDDVLNPVALGVNEAVGRYLNGDAPQLVPFAYVANKMFFCRPAQHEAYLGDVARFMTGRGHDPSFQFYVEQTAKGEDLRRSFFGVDVLIVTG